MQHLDLDSTDLTWLRGLARALVRDCADDLVQDAVAVALDGRMPRGAAPRAWLAGVVRRLAAQRYRADGRRRQRELLAAQAEALTDTSELVARAEVAERVSAVARGLEEPLRRTVLLRFMEGRSVAEIAALEGKGADTVRWRLRRGLERMREELVRGGELDWSAWSAALLPLANGGAGSGTSMGGVGVHLGTGIGLWSGMKALGIVGALALGLGLWWAAREGMTAGPLEAGAGAPGSLAALSPTAAAQLVEGAEPRGAAEDAGAAREGAASMESIAPVADDYTGQVVDPAGEPVVGATVWLAAKPEQASMFRGATLGKAETDGRGRFTIDSPELAFEMLGEDWRPDLGVVANGFLRRVWTEVALESEREPLVLVLERGLGLSGRVVDESGAGVPGLELLAHTRGSSIGHMSPSRVLQRQESAQLGGRDSSFDSALAVTDAAGNVEFSGLPAGELLVRSLDPGWAVVQPAIVAAGDRSVEWRAERRLGVVLVGLEGGSGGPLGQISATFRVELTLGDGRVEDVGQWVGSGAGKVSMSIGPEDLPPELRGVGFASARFFGEADTLDFRSYPTTWTAEAFVPRGGEGGVALARVEIDRLESPKELGEEMPDEVEVPYEVGRLVLDVRYADATPFDGRLAGESDVSLVGGGEFRTGLDLRRVAAGTFEARAVAGDHELEISDGRASGSLPPWRGKASVAPGETTRVFVELVRGAEAEIQRPAGWDGEWFVRAARRSSSEADWDGAWTYSTREDLLTLAALEPAEWRFQLRREPDLAVEVLERLVVLEAGDRVRVE